MPSWPEVEPRHPRVLLTLAALALAIAACGPGAAASARPTISDAWVRMPTPGASTTAAYLRIENPGGLAEVLLAVSSPVAASASLHRTTTASEMPGTSGSDMGGMTEMTPVDAIHIPAGGTVTLEPGGFHVMLAGLTRELARGDRVELVLTFEHAGVVHVTAEVRAG